MGPDHFWFLVGWGGGNSLLGSAAANQFALVGFCFCQAGESLVHAIGPGRDVLHEISDAQSAILLLKSVYLASFMPW